MDMGRFDSASPKRLGATGNDGDFITAEMMQKLQRVRGGARKPDIAGHGDDADDVEFG